jgi:alpha-L-rhamnosidase
MHPSFFKKVLWCFGLLLASTTAMATSVTHLTTEFMNEPMGIDVSHPRFSWQMQSDRYGAAQTAYRVVVASSQQNLNNATYVFDTGKTASSASIGIEYQGDVLLPCTRYYWKVTVWDEKGAAVTSDTEWFETGLTDFNWHHAQWIGSSKQTLSKYRSRFILDYDFQLAKKSHQAVFVYGAKSANNYLTVTVDTKEGAKLLLGHVLNGTATIDGEGDISSLMTQTKVPTTHHIRLSVYGKDNYEVYVDFDGQRIKCSKDGKNFNERTVINNTTEEDTNANNRLYQIGFCQPKGEDATFSQIKISDTSWHVNLYTDNAVHAVKGDGNISLWQPGSDASAPMLRRTVQIAKAIKQARLYATARGIYQYYINGKAVGESFYNPGWTDYRYRIMYNTFDVTSLLRQGANGIGAMIGAGWYSDVLGWVGADWQDQYGIHQSTMALLHIDYEDGTSENIVTNNQWKCYDLGPIEANSLYNGEDYNAQKEVDGWTNGNFDDSQWVAATIANAPAQTVKLQAYVGMMIQNNVTLQAKSVKKVGNVFIYDFGQNMVGVPRLSGLHGKAGQRITIHYAEMLYPDVIPEKPVEPYTIEMYKAKKGQMYLDNYRSALSTDHYTFKGDAAGETYEPLFTSHGFRYLSIEGLDEALPLSSVEGIVVESIGKQTSNYETSNKDVNRLFQNIVWGQRGNFLSVPTDCPQRDERLGWTGDAQIFSRAATYNMNTDPFYTRWFYTVRDDQALNGDLGGYYPDLGTPPAGAYAATANARAGGWSDFGVIIPWQMYQQYGDTGILLQEYESMSRYMNFLERTGKDYIFPAGGFGDWVAPVPTNTSLINTAYWAYDAQIMQKVAVLLGKTQDAARYGRVFDKIKAAFNKTFVDRDGYTIEAGKEGTKRIDTQTSYILPLQFGLFTDSTKSKAVAHLVDRIVANGNRLSTGFLGTPYLCLVLSDSGHPDLAYKLFLQTEYPSWLFPVLQGATTIWERWNSYTILNGFGPVGMNSFNHYSYGAIEEWMMSHSLGIQRDEKSPAYKHILLQPEIGDELDYAKGGFQSMYGDIQSGWEKNANGYTYKVTIPANTTASLTLPAANVKSVKVLKGKEGITRSSFKNGKALFELKAGTYEFTNNK